MMREAIQNRLARPRGQLCLESMHLQWERVVLERADRPSRGSEIRADIQFVRIRLQHHAELCHGGLRGSGTA